MSRQLIKNLSSLTYKRLNISNSFIKHGAQPQNYFTRKMSSEVKRNQAYVGVS
jgi:hypothetical protein